MQPKGLTMVELAIVVAILGLLSMVTYPTLRNLGERDRATGVVSHTSHLLNEMKDRARRRNRAHLVSISSFSEDEPLGELRVVEALTSSCRAAVDQEDDLENVVVRATYGLSPSFDNERRFGLDKDESIGFATVIPEAALDGGRVFICLKPDGAILNAHTLEPFPPGEDANRAGALELRLQRFTPAGDIAGPARGIMIPFAGPARLRMESGA